MHPKRKQIGIRVPDNQIALDLLGYIGEPFDDVEFDAPERANANDRSLRDNGDARPHA